MLCYIVLYHMAHIVEGETQYECNMDEKQCMLQFLRCAGLGTLSSTTPALVQVTLTKWRQASSLCRKCLRFRVGRAPLAPLSRPMRALIAWRGTVHPMVERAGALRSGGEVSWERGDGRLALGTGRHDHMFRRVASLQLFFS